MPTLIGGDFNEDEDGQALRWLNDRGMHTALPEFSPGAKTWEWQVASATISARYDHLVYNEKLRPLKVSVRSGVGRSDHLPVVGVFGLADVATESNSP